MRPRHALLVLLVTASLGCKNGKKHDDGTPDADDDTALVEDGSDSAAAESDSQLITSSLVSGAPGPLKPASAELTSDDTSFNAFGDGAKAIYFPRNCLQVQADEATSTAKYVFDRCMGPNGLRNVTGTVEARYTVQPGELRLELTATDLRVNRAMIDWTASAVVTQKDGTRTMTWRGQLAGVTARGREFTRTNERTVEWQLGESCFTLNGTSDGEVGARQLHSEIQNYRRCRRACPDAGGKVIVTNVTKNKTVEIRFDGTNRATVVGPNGGESSIPLLCGEP